MFVFGKGRTALASAVLLFLAGCGGGGSDSGSEPEKSPPNESKTLTGTVFDGPVVGADVAIYKLENGKKSGNPIDTGITGNRGQIAGIDSNRLTTPPYLLEVTANDETRDLDTGKPPVLKTMTSVILEPGQTEIQATTLTTLAVNSALQDSSDVAFDKKVTQAVNRVVSIIPVDLPAGLDVFTFPPVPEPGKLDEENLEKISKYWTASQAALSIVNTVVEAAKDADADSELTVDEVLNEVAKDLTDGKVDGRDDTGKKINDAVASEESLNLIKTPVLDELTIPNVDGEPVKVTEFSKGIKKYIDQRFENDAQPPVIDESKDVELAPVADLDSDDDGVNNDVDAFPLDPKEALDTDEDGVGNKADTDDDNDGLSDSEEEKDGTDPLKADTDGDGVNDKQDAFPKNGAESVDTDGDGIGNNADEDDDGDGLSDAEEKDKGTNSLKPDTDNDGVNDKIDIFPKNSTESVDTDNDGVGNNADTDDDNDGLSDVEEATKGTNPLKADTDGDGINDKDDAYPKDGTEASDQDGDSIGDNADNCPTVANPDQKDSDSDQIGDACDAPDTVNAVWDETNWDQANWQ